MYTRLVINQSITWAELAAKALELALEFDGSFSKLRLAALIDRELANLDPQDEMDFPKLDN